MIATIGKNHYNLAKYFISKAIIPMSFIYPPTLPACLPIANRDELFAVRRVYCVGRNYADHAREMGADPLREPPFFFCKPNDNQAILSVLPDQLASLPYPSKTQNLHYEVELVVAIGKNGKDIAVENAIQHIFGYAVGLDMTRRDLQENFKKNAHPWDMAKAFDYSAPIGMLHTIQDIGEITSGNINLKVNNHLKQQGDISQLIWNVNEVIANLSSFVELKTGDLIFTGTPAGVGAVVKDDIITAYIDKLSNISLKII